MLTNHDLSELMSTNDPVKGPNHRTINGEVFHVTENWVAEARKTAKGRGLILTALMHVGRQYRIQLKFGHPAYTGWTYTLHVVHERHYSMHDDPLEAIMGAFCVLKYPERFPRG